MMDQSDVGNPAFDPGADSSEPALVSPGYDGADLDENLEAAFPSDEGQIGDVEISNFAESGLTDSATVRDYVEQAVPPEHLQGLDGLDYANSQEAYDEGLMGEWESNLATGENTIQIYPHDDRKEMYDTIAHEIGHNAEAVIEQQNPETVQTWNALYDHSLTALNETGGEQNEFVTPYATTSPDEDFAESYATYINDPPLLQSVSPEKYEFMETQVFADPSTQ